jgi:hypothetical protein
MRFRTPTSLAVLLALALGAASLPRAVAAQLAPADTAAVLVETARLFEADGRWEVAEALYRLVLERYAGTVAAAAARARLVSPPTEVVYGDGSVELSVWTTLYGASLGIAVPGAFGADSPEPYGVGLIVGGPAGLLLGRRLAGRLSLTEGQARAITFGGTWGAWQFAGWREVFDIGIEEVCDPGFGFCFEAEDDTEETFAALVVGSLAGVAVGALFSGRDITPGTGTVVNFASLWGTWFGLAGGVLVDLEDGDDLLAAALLGGDAALLTAALLAPGWNVSRSRARLVSIAGVLGGLAGAGLDLIVQPDDEKVAIAIPLVGSIAGLAIGIGATRDSAAPGALEAAADGSLLRYDEGRWSVGLPTPFPTLVPSDQPNGSRWSPAISFEVFRAAF